MDIEKSTGKQHFHFLLIGGFIPIFGIALGIIFLAVNIGIGGNEEHKSWTRKIAAVLALDVIIFSLITILYILILNNSITLPEQAKGGMSRRIFSSRSAIGIFVEKKSDILGARIKKVIPDSPADRAKMVPGDIIVRVNKTVVQDSKQITKILSRAKPGVPIDVYLYRNRKNLMKRIVPVEPEELYGSNRAWDPQNWSIDNIDKKQWYTWILFILIMAAVILVSFIRNNRSAALSMAIVLLTIIVSTFCSYLLAWSMGSILMEMNIFIPLFILFVNMILILVFSLAGRNILFKKYPAIFQYEKTMAIPKAIGLGVLYNYTIFFRVMIIAGLINLYLIKDTPPGMPFLLYLNDPIVLAVTIAVIVLIGPIAEEIAFRGVLFTGLRSWLKKEHAFVLSAAIFALLHVPQYGIHAVGIIWYGIVFAWLYQRTGKLLVPVALHVIINSVSTVMFFLIYR
jgi:membrane protease YdiL (CAAX protease family)